MPTNKEYAQLPSRAALNVLGKGQRTAIDYAKLAPDALKQPSSVPSTVLQLVAKGRKL